MGIFTSFATGFLEGSVQVQKEKAAAELEQQKTDADRRDKLGTIIFDLIKDDKLTGDQGAELLGRSDLTRADIAGMVNTIDAVDSQIFTYGNFRYNKPEDWDQNIRGDNLLLSGSTWMRTMNTVAQTPKLWDKLSKELQNNPTARKNFDNDFARYADYYTMGMIKENTNLATGVTSAYLEPSKAYAPLYDSLANLKIDAPDNSDKVIIENNKDIEIPANSVVFKFKDTEGLQQSEPREFTEGQYTSLEAIAINLGYKGKGNTSAVQQLVNNFVDVSRADNAEDAYKVLLAAAELERIGASAFNRTAGVGTEDAARIGNELTQKFGDDRILMAQAMAPLMTLDEDQFNKNSRLSYSMQPAAVYFKKYLDVDVAQVREQYSETQETLRLLNELKSKVAKETTPTGFVASLKSVFGGAFGEGGQLEQLLGTNTDGVSSEQVLERAKTLGFISTTIIKDLSEIEAMKLTLAAKMARAIDPSGRLSNQDFEVQLQRLGQSGLFTGKVQAASKLDIVIEDFTNRSKRLVVLNDIANAPEFKAREARLLKANGAIQKSMDARRSGVYTTSDSGMSSVADTGNEEKKKLTLDSDLGFYTDGTSFYYDEEGTKPVPSSEVDKKMNEVYS